MGLRRAVLCTNVYLRATQGCVRFATIAVLSTTKTRKSLPALWSVTRGGFCFAKGRSNPGPGSGPFLPGTLNWERAPKKARCAAREEANATLILDRLLGVYTVARISQVQLIYRASLVDGRYSAGEETEEARLFSWDEIPWDDIAFPTVIWALRHWNSVRDRNEFPPFTNPEGGMPESSPAP